MYNEVIKKLLQKIEALPEKLVVMYLMKVYKLSQPMALQAVYAAYKSRVAYQKGGYAVRNPHVEINSALRHKGTAFRVCWNFSQERPGVYLYPQPLDSQLYEGEPLYSGLPH